MREQVKRGGKRSGEARRRKRAEPLELDKDGVPVELRALER
jgi:hypothetical protein